MIRGYTIQARLSTYLECLSEYRIGSAFAVSLLLVLTHLLTQIFDIPARLCPSQRQPAQPTVAGKHIRTIRLRRMQKWLDSYPHFNRQIAQVHITPEGVDTSDVTAPERLTQAALTPVCKLMSVQQVLCLGE